VSAGTWSESPHGGCSVYKRELQKIWENQPNVRGTLYHFFTELEIYFEHIERPLQFPMLSAWPENHYLHTEELPEALKEIPASLLLFFLLLLLL